MPTETTTAAALTTSEATGSQILQGLVDPTPDALTINEIATNWWGSLSYDNIALQFSIVIVAVVTGFILARRLNNRALAFSISSIDALAHKEDPTFIERMGVKLVQFMKELLAGISFSFISGSIVAIGAFAMTKGLGFKGESLIFCNVAYNLLYAFALLSVILQFASLLFGTKVLTPGVKRFLRIGFWILVVLQFFGILGQAIEFMEGTRIPFGGGNVTLWTVFVAILTILLSLGIANWMADIAENLIESSKGLSKNVQVALARVVRILLFIVAVCMGLSSVGIDLTVLSVFGGAVGVGLGFGLQKIASNYISGFIILLDRSVKIGDLVEVANFRGRVTEINTRFTVVRNNDGVECVVPNESFVTSAVRNYSYTDEPVVQYIDISIAYDADVTRALEIMLEEGMRERPRIVKGRRGWSYVDSFGASGINLKLGFWCADPVNGTAGLRTQISPAILKRFQEEGIEVPYNQLEINLRKVDAPVAKVDIEKSAPEKA